MKDYKQTALSELIKADRKFLTNLEAQAAYVVQIDSRPYPCPICAEPCNVFQAMGLDVDKAVFDDAYPTNRAERKYTCPKCKAPLTYLVPFVAIPQPWFWSFNQDRAKQEHYKIEF